MVPPSTIDNDPTISDIIYSFTPSEYKTVVTLIKRDLYKELPLI